jgi:hypothetical protein
VFEALPGAAAGLDAYAAGKSAGTVVMTVVEDASGYADFRAALDSSRPLGERLKAGAVGVLKAGALAWGGRKLFGGAGKAAAGEATIADGGSVSTARGRAPRTPFDAAAVARDAELAKLKELPASQRKRVSTVVGAVDLESGATAVGKKITGSPACVGKCAEDLAREALVGRGAKPENVRYSPAVRPRTDEVVPVCPRCQTQTTPDQYPPDVKWDPTGPWTKRE